MIAHVNVYCNPNPNQQNSTKSTQWLDDTIRHSPALTRDSGTFQGHCVKVDTQDEIIPSIHAIYSVARATHNTYAYRIRSGDRVIEHYDDDGEYGAGAKLLELMRQHGVVDKLLCVTRWLEGR